jgi:hypothetical protein
MRLLVSPDFAVGSLQLCYGAPLFPGETIRGKRAAGGMGERVSARLWRSATSGPLFGG